MKNIQLLFEKNPVGSDTPKLEKGRYVYKCKSNELNGDEIIKLLKYLNKLNDKFTKIRIAVVLDFRSVKTIADKLTYIVLECICYYLMVQKKQNIQLVFDVKKINIFTEGFLSSPLFLISGRKPKESRSLFPEKFKFDLYKSHYRKVINGDIETNSNYLGKIMNDINLFLINLNLSESCSEEVSETLAELIGNAIEHTDSDCLVDIDVTEKYKKDGDDDHTYYGINIVVLNFSEKLLGEALKDKIENVDLGNQERYGYVKRAHSNHSTHFGSKYQENDFFNIASFQHRISGDYRKIDTGGKGLTQLIKSLENRSDNHACYMMSGNRVLYFHHKFMQFDSDYWIGFNGENDFLNHIPNDDCISWSRVYFPGTAYNLNFIMRKEDDYDRV